MKLPVLLGLLAFTAFGISGCGKLGNDYEPGIGNRGYVPGQGQPTAQLESEGAEKFNQTASAIAPNGGNS